MATPSSSPVGETIWIDPASIRFKIGPSVDLTGIVDGDWDIQRRHDLASTVKYRAIVQHFTDDVRWQDTELFQRTYARRLAKGEKLRGANNLTVLAARYQDEIDTLYAAMKRDGFRLRVGSSPSALPRLLIGRDGEIFIGNQGNHRLAISQLLGLERFAGRIICCHSSRICR